MIKKILATIWDIELNKKRQLDLSNIDLNLIDWNSKKTSPLDQTMNLIMSAIMDKIDDHLFLLLELKVNNVNIDLHHKISYLMDEDAENLLFKGISKESMLEKEDEPSLFDEFDEMIDQPESESVEPLLLTIDSEIKNCVDIDVDAELNEVDQKIKEISEKDPNEELEDYLSTTFKSHFAFDFSEEDPIEEFKKLNLNRNQLKLIKKILDKGTSKEQLYQTLETVIKRGISSTKITNVLKKFT